MQKKYEEVIAWIRGELREGRLKQGDKLPSENMLKKRFHVSRQTVGTVCTGGRADYTECAWQRNVY